MADKQVKKTEDKGRCNDSVGIVGFPFSKGQPRGGTELGPKELREADLVNKLKQYCNIVSDHGDIEPENVPNDNPVGIVKNSLSVGASNKKLSEGVAKYLKQDKSLIVLGGDHCLGIGSIHGHAQVSPDLVVVWVDAHADINTPLTSTSGNIHGMPLAFVVKDLEKYVPKLPGFKWCKPCISIKDIVYIGLRDVDPGERKIIEEHTMHSYSMHEVDELGIQKVVEKALKDVDPNGTRPIHLSLDVDGIDPAMTPSTGTPVDGGLTMREILYLAETIAKTGRLQVLDVAEVNPKLGSEEDVKKTAKNAVDVAAQFFGRHRQGNAGGYKIPEASAGPA